MNNTLKQIYQTECHKFYTSIHGKKIHCAVCGDTEDDLPIIKISNSNQLNPYLCSECMNFQSQLYGLKFSKIKNGKSRIM